VQHAVPPGAAHRHRACAAPVEGLNTYLERKYAAGAEADAADAAEEDAP
jgi:hypothetical protein